MTSSDKSPVDLDLTGVLLVGKEEYICVNKLGRGSFALVWRVFALPSKTVYAVKIHSEKNIIDAEDEINTQKELTQLETPFAPHYIDHFPLVYEEKHYNCTIVKIMNTSLYDGLDTYKYGYPVDFVIDVTKKILQTLKSIHKVGIVHSDIKPENILIKWDDNKYDKIIQKICSSTDHTVESVQKIIIDHKNQCTSNKKIEVDDNESDWSDCTEESTYYYEKPRILVDTTIESDDVSSYTESSDVVLFPLNNVEVMLCDWGLSYNVNAKKLLHYTQHYKAPEMILVIPHDTKIDIWSLGCTVYELLTGKLLFTAKHPNYDILENNQKTIYDNRHHIQTIIEKIGMIPPEVIEKSDWKCLYFTNNMQLKCVEKIEHDDTWRIMFEHIHKHQTMNSDSTERLNKLFVCMMQMLDINHTTRLSAESLLDNDLFK